MIASSNQNQSVDYYLMCEWMNGWMDELINAWMGGWVDAVLTRFISSDYSKFWFVICKCDFIKFNEIIIDAQNGFIFYESILILKCFDEPSTRHVLRYNEKELFQSNLGEKKKHNSKHVKVWMLTSIKLNENENQINIPNGPDTFSSCIDCNAKIM